MQNTHGMMDDGREAQFREMMERFEEIQSKYRGVRGELLAKVREELMRLKPSANSTATAAPTASSTSSTVSTIAPAPAPSPARAVVAQALPSCRLCGRGMKAVGDGTIVCEKGHTRLLAG